MTTLDTLNPYASGDSGDILFAIDQNRYSRQDCQPLLERFREHPLLARPASARIAVCLGSTLEWLVLCLYLRQHGGSVLPVHPSTPLPAARDLARKTGCSHLIHGSLDQTETLAPAPGDLPEGGELIQLSSGTTGAQRAIRRRWRDIDRELDSYLGSFPEADHLTPVLACPVTHSYGLICGFLAGLRRGRQPQVITNLNPRFILARLKATEAPLLYASPSLLTLLLHMLPAEARFEAVMVSGATMPEALLARLRQGFRQVCQQYGCSEAGCIALTADLQAANDLGRCLPHLELSAGSDPLLPEEIRVHDGLRLIATGDLGYVDGDGHLRFVARIDDTINVAGINVYPGDVEEVLLGHPDIRDAVAFRRPDTYAGERVCLRFVADRALDIESLRQWCRQRLSPHQVPVELDQVASIPRLANGKVSRRQLAQTPAGPAAAEVQP